MQLPRSFKMDQHDWPVEVRPSVIIGKVFLKAQGGVTLDKQETDDLIVMLQYYRQEVFGDTA